VDDVYTGVGLKYDGVPDILAADPQYFDVLANDIDAANDLKDIKLVDPTDPNAFVTSIRLLTGSGRVGTVTVVVSLGSNNTHSMDIVPHNAHACPAAMVLILVLHAYALLHCCIAHCSTS
jgi:hypothetical protein